MSCNDDLTLSDVTAGLHTSALSRLNAGSAANNNLYGAIDRDQVHGLNVGLESEGAGEPKVLIKPWDERASTEPFVESGVDDQLIIHVPFTHSVRLKSILLHPGRGGIAPLSLKVFLNHAAGLDFSQAEEMQPVQEFSLEEDSAMVVGESVREYPVRVAKFSNVSCLTLFFPESRGAFQTRLYYLGFKGESLQPKKEEADKLDIRAANAADSVVDSVKERAAPGQSSVR